MIPPPNIGDKPYDSSRPPLIDNCFAISGPSVGHLAPFEVVDEQSGVSCQLSVTTNTRRVVHGEFEEGEQPAPGAVQLEGSVEVRFSPAEPGRIYRLSCSTGAMRRRYEGQPIAGGAGAIGLVIGAAGGLLALVLAVGGIVVGFALLGALIWLLFG